MSNDVWTFDDINPEGDLNTGGAVLPGWYHVQILNYSIEGREKGLKHDFIGQIIGTVNDPKFTPMIGRKLYFSLYDWTPFFKRQATALAIACDYWNTATISSAKSQGLGMTAPDFSQFESRTFVGKVETEEFTGNDGEQKKAAKVTAFYAVTSKEAQASGVAINSLGGVSPVQAAGMLD